MKGSFGRTKNEPNMFHLTGVSPQLALVPTKPVQLTSLDI